MSVGASDSRLAELDGVVASIVPATPDRSVLNSVVYEGAGHLEAAGTRAESERTVHAEVDGYVRVGSVGACVEALSTEGLPDGVWLTDQGIAAYRGR